MKQAPKRKGKRDPREKWIPTKSEVRITHRFKGTQLVVLVDDRFVFTRHQKNGKIILHRCLTEEPKTDPEGNAILDTDGSPVYETVELIEYWEVPSE